LTISSGLATLCIVKTHNRSASVAKIKQRLWEIAFEAETRTGRAFDIILLWMIGLSVATIMIGTVPGIELKYRDTFIAIE
jgi:hypothetical protein